MTPRSSSGVSCVGAVEACAAAGGKKGERLAGASAAPNDAPAAAATSAATKEEAERWSKRIAKNKPADRGSVK
jgi:hypothetical protein